MPISRSAKRGLAIARNQRRRRDRRNSFPVFLAKYPGKCWVCSYEVMGTPCVFHEGVVVHARLCLHAVVPNAKVIV